MDLYSVLCGLSKEVTFKGKSECKAVSHAKPMARASQPQKRAGAKVLKGPFFQGGERASRLKQEKEADGEQWQAGVLRGRQLTLRPG